MIDPVMVKKAINDKQLKAFCRNGHIYLQDTEIGDIVIIGETAVSPPKPSDFTEDLINWLAHKVDDRELDVPIELICKKLHEHGLIDKIGGKWILKKKDHSGEATEMVEDAPSRVAVPSMEDKFESLLKQADDLIKFEKEMLLMDEDDRSCSTCGYSPQTPACETCEGYSNWWFDGDDSLFDE